MIKSGLTALITGFADAGLNTAAEFRAQQTELLNNIYPAPVSESGDIADAGYTIPSEPSDYLYNVQLTKTGRRVFIEGWIKNDSGTNIGDVGVFYFPALVDGQANEYYPDDNFDFKGEALQRIMGTRIKLVLSEGLFKVDGNFLLSANNIYDFSMSYNAKN